MTPPARAPVIVSRTFRNGNGLAYPAALAADNPVRPLIDQLAPFAGEKPPPNGWRSLDDGRHLLVVRTDDPDCPDPKAEGRHPRIIRAAIFDSLPPHWSHAAIGRSLLTLPLPEKAGPQPTGLEIDIPAFPSMPQPGASWRDRAVRSAPGAVAVLAVAATVGTTVLADGGLVWGAVAGLVAAIGLGQLAARLPQPRFDAAVARTLEERLLDDRAAANTEPVGDELPVYTGVRGGSGWGQVAGSEADGGVRRPFVRWYVWDHGCWCLAAS